MKKIFTYLMLLVVLCGYSTVVVADDNTAEFTVTPSNTESNTGEEFSMTLSCKKANSPTASAVFTFEIEENYRLQRVDAGESVENGEISYSYTENTLVIIYLDNDGGETALKNSDIVANIVLKAVDSGTSEPLKLKETDAATVTASGMVIEQKIELTVSSVTIIGESVSLPTPSPIVEDNEEPEDSIPDNVSSNSNVQNSNTQSDFSKNSLTSSSAESSESSLEKENTKFEVQSQVVEESENTSKLEEKESIPTKEGLDPLTTTTQLDLSGLFVVSGILIIIGIVAAYIVVKNRK